MGGRTCRKLPKSPKVGAVAALSSRSRPRGQQLRGPCPPTGQDWRPLPVSAGGARAASRWQSRARALQPARPRAAVAASRVEAGASAACGCHAFTFFTPGRAATDRWRYVSDAVLKTHRRGPRSLQKTYPKEASVALSSHRGTHCARRGV